MSLISRETPAALFLDKYHMRSHLEAPWRHKSFVARLKNAIWTGMKEVLKEAGPLLILCLLTPQKGASYPMEKDRGERGWTKRRLCCTSQKMRSELEECCIYLKRQFLCRSTRRPNEWEYFDGAGFRQTEAKWGTEIFVARLRCIEIWTGEKSFSVCRLEKEGHLEPWQGCWCRRPFSREHHVLYGLPSFLDLDRKMPARHLRICHWRSSFV